MQEELGTADPALPEGRTREAAQLPQGKTPPSPEGLPHVVKPCFEFVASPPLLLPFFPPSLSFLLSSSTP